MQRFAGRHARGIQTTGARDEAPGYFLFIQIRRLETTDALQHIMQLVIEVNPSKV